MSRTEGLLEPADDEVRPSIVVLGTGRVGRVVVRAVRNRGFRCVVIDRDPRKLEEAARSGAVTMFGDAANPHILDRAGLARARVLIVAIGDPLTARLATERALRIQSAADGRVESAWKARDRRAAGRRRGPRRRPGGRGRVRAGPSRAPADGRLGAGADRHPDRPASGRIRPLTERPGRMIEATLPLPPTPRRTRR